MDKPVPALVKKELLKGETIKWSGQPDRREVLKAVAPLSFLAGGILAIYLSVKPLHLFNHDVSSFVYLFIELIPVMLLAALIFSPLYFIWRAGKIYYLLTNNRILIVRTERGLNSSSAAFADTVGDIRVSFSGGKNIAWLEADKTKQINKTGPDDQDDQDDQEDPEDQADQTNSTAFINAPMQRPKRFTFYALTDSSVDKIKKAAPDIFDSYNRDHKVCKSLKDCLLEGETIALISDLPSQVVSKNPVRTMIQLFLCLAAPLVVWLLIIAYLFWSHQAPLSASLANMILPMLGLLGVLHLYRRFGETIAERAQATRLVITNYRIFQAPSDAIMAAGKWHGRKNLLDIYFADQLSVTRGSAKKIDYFDFKAVNQNFSTGTDNRYATSNQRIWVTEPDKVYESFPDYFKNNQFEYCKGEYISDAHTRALAFIAARKARLEIEGSKGEISAD